MTGIAGDLREIARLAAKRMPVVARSMEVTLADCDSSVYRMAIFHAVLEDKPKLDAVLSEIERLARIEVNKLLKENK